VPRPIPDLPSRYYLDHFLEMIGFVTATYDHALDPAHRSFLKDFAALSLDARCLYVRIANRRGRVFHRDQLRYSEIGDVGGATRELSAAGFVRAPGPGDLRDLLRLDSRATLVARLRRHFAETGASHPLGSLKKEGLVRLGLECFEFASVFSERDREPILVQIREEEVAYLLFLYFGSVERDLTTFALRDLGRVRTAPFLKEFKARFETASAARGAFFYSRVLDSLEDSDPGLVRELVAGLAEWPLDPDPHVTTLRHRALHGLGRTLERDGQADAALEVYLLSDQYPSTERTVRLLHAAGRTGEAEALLRRLIDDPSCDGELLFAEDFLERKFQKKRTGRLTDLLRHAPILGLDESGRERPEATAVSRLCREGAEAAHVENRLWLQLFGLLFWDLLFGPGHASLHDPFDFMPQDLRSGVFLEKHRDAVEARLDLLDDPVAANAYLESVREAHAGLPNSIVAWDDPLFTWTRRLVTHAPRGGLAAILREMARDYRSNRSGFPDLVVFDREGLRFVELKTEGDQIRRQQLVQIERLRRAGFRVEVARVRWIVDTGQDYVVVDVETTGSDPARHRLTEVGAVRVRGGRIIGEWSSLVNPERRIPAFISQLTGITDAMVAGAPRFAEVAPGLREFLGDSVFVAHRARFDHGFLKAEFERCGIAFGGPVLCTVVESRRHFPGLPSHGLATLSKHFGISLDSHHRALCDARATAEIFLKIQEKRVAVSEQNHAPEDRA
jgi:DNA polymerase-3 subunit epsilon